MFISIQISKDAADELGSEAPFTDETRELLKAIEELDIVLNPLASGPSSSILDTFFTVEVPDTQTAEKVIDRIQACKAVKAAYIKPRDEAPGA